jgi:hypothetical protein
MPFSVVLTNANPNRTKRTHDNYYCWQPEVEGAYGTRSGSTQAKNVAISFGMIGYNRSPREQILNEDALGVR